MLYLVKQRDGSFITKWAVSREELSGMQVLGEAPKDKRGRYCDPAWLSEVNDEIQIDQDKMDAFYESMDNSEKMLEEKRAAYEATLKEVKTLINNQSEDLRKILNFLMNGR